MMEFLDTTDWIFFIELFIVMLGAFLIGYYFGKRNILGKSQNSTKTQKNKEININDIETIFSEIKPDIIKIIENHKDKSKESEAGQNVSKKLKLNFNTIGYSDALNKDDLTKIEGLSPFIEDKLNQLGIFSYSQISRFTPEDIETITQLIEYFPGRIVRDNWVGQAKKFENKKATHQE